MDGASEKSTQIGPTVGAVELGIACFSIISWDGLAWSLRLARLDRGTVLVTGSRQVNLEWESGHSQIRRVGHVLSAEIL